MRRIGEWLLFAVATPALAGTWSSDVPLRVADPGTPTASVLSVSADLQGGHRAVVELSDGRVELLHFDADQQLLSASLRLAGNVAGPYPRSTVIELENGAVYALDDTLVQARLDVDGQVAWARQHPFNRCLWAHGAPNSVLWSICRDRNDDYALMRTDDVGRADIRYELPIGRMTSLYPAADHGAFYADYLGSGAIGRLEADGSWRWYFSPTTLEDVFVEGMHELENGHVLLVGRFWNAPRLRLMERDLGGMLVDFTDVDLDFAPREILLSRREVDGSLLLLFDRAAQGADLLMQIKADGGVGWQFALPDEAEVYHTELGRYALLRTADLETRFITSRFRFVDGESHLEHRFMAIDAAGQLRVDAPLGDDDEFKDFEPRPTYGDFLSAGRYARIDGNGLVGDLLLPPRYSGQEQPKVLAVHSEGDERLVVVDTAANRQLQAWTRAGQLRWTATLRRDFALFGESDARDAHQMVAEQASCFSAVSFDGDGNFTSPPVECFDRLTGAALASFPFEPVFGTYRVPLLLHDGVLVSQHESESGVIVRFRSAQDGSELRPSRPLLGVQLGGEPGGVGTYFMAEGGIEVHWFDGRQPDSLFFPYGNLIEFPTALSAEGVIIGANWYPRDGSNATPIPAEVGSIVQANVDDFPLILYGIRPDGQHALSALDAATGAIVWSRVIAAYQGMLHVRLAKGPGDVHFIGEFGHDLDIDLDLIAYERATGRELGRHSIECEGPPCQLLLDGRVTSPSGLDLLLLRQQTDATTALRAVHLPPLGEGATVDQPAVAGLWYHPGLQGQGFVLTYVEDTHTLFAPWFTYDDYGVNGDESDMRWYSLQGQAEAGAAFARLDILQNRNGHFNEPPATAAEVIGEAILRLDESCDRATLYFRYDPEVSAGQPDQIPLVRLGQRTRPCDMPDGQVAPPALAAADNAGFSIRQSGAWFDSNTSGQGLMLEVVPASGSQDGLLFGAWFTYDRPELANDFAAQDWFILQGDLAGAAAGRVRLPIYRSIGGEGLRRPTANLFVVGEAELQFNDCSELQVSYAFAEDPHAGVHAGLQGELELERIGGCELP